MALKEYNALKYNQHLIQGQSFEKSYTLSEDDTVLDTSVPFDLSLYTVTGSIRRSFDDATAVDFQIALSDSGTGTVDTFKLFLGATASESLATGTWVYDVEMRLISNPEKVEKLLYGNFFVKPEVTR